MMQQLLSLLKFRKSNKIPSRKARKIRRSAIVIRKNEKTPPSNSLKKPTRKYFKRAFLYVLIFILGIFVFFSFVYYSNFFAIADITIDSSQKDLVVQGVDELWGENLIFLKLHAQEKRLLQLNPTISSIKLQKEYPSTIKIFLKLQEATAAFEVDSGFFILSYNGQILKKIKGAKDTNLTHIKYYQKLIYSTYPVGEYITYSDIQQALFFIKILKDLGQKVNEVDIGGVDMIRLKLKNREIILTTQKPRSTQKYQLETVIRQFAISGQEFRILDLRFEKPIITY